MNKNKLSLSKFFLELLLSFLKEFNRKRRLYISILASFVLIAIATYINMSEYTFFSNLNMEEFKLDMAPNRDVLATEDVNYVDEDATMQKKNAKRRLFGAVLERDDEEDARIKKTYEDFVGKLRNIMDSEQNEGRFIEKINGSSFSNTQEKKGSEIDPASLSALYNSSNAYDILNTSISILDEVLKRGVVNFSHEMLENYGTKDATVIYLNNNKTENVDFSSLIFLHHKEGFFNIDVQSFVEKSLQGKSYEYELCIPSLLRPYLKANVTYNREETERRIKNEIDKIPNVVRTIYRGEKIIEKNVVIKEEAYNKLKQYIENKKGGMFVNASLFFAVMIYIICCYALSFFLFSIQSFGEAVEDKYFLLLLLMCTTVYLEVLFLSRLNFFSSIFSIIPFLPSSLFSMLIYILKSKKMAIFSSILITLSILPASNFDVALSLFSLFSGFAGIALVKNTGRRIDLIKTSGILAIIQPLMVFTLALLFPNAESRTFFSILGSAFNGFFSGVLLLGFLPLIEVVLNCPTTFRLIEISDLNSPLMKQMLLTVSGTYSHSMMVATLAENACRAIGANALLARAGAYYHDIGKMEMGEYFIENQHDGINKHDSIPPRLSATVLRSHVQHSIEKARAMHLPESVVDIIAEHHGNGLIAYFYNKAKEAGENVDEVDFSYPGRKPRSRESAVVMLSDITEAGCRSLSKHSVPALTKFINGIFKAKMDSGQLDECGLTFRDITIIKNTFIDILSGYYHSRIKYPNQKDDDDVSKENSSKEASPQLKEKEVSKIEDKSISKEGKNG